MRDASPFTRTTKDTHHEDLSNCFAAAVLFAGMIASASAGERAASVSKSTLGSMGLGGMHQMSDNDGLAVRGKGTSASVWGSGIATIHGTATQTSGYSASASHPFGSASANGGEQQPGQRHSRQRGWLGQLPRRDRDRWFVRLGEVTPPRDRAVSAIV